MSSTQAQATLRPVEWDLSGVPSAPGSHARVFARNIIIPVHMPRAPYILNAFAPIRDHVADDVLLTLVATSAPERESLERYVRLMNWAPPCALEIVSAIEICRSYGLLGVERAVRTNRENGIVNFKKLLALHRAAALGAEEILCVDSDCAFIKPLGECFDRLKANHDTRTFVAGHAGLAAAIVDASIDAFGPQGAQQLRSVVGSPPLYSWFYDAPYYPREELMGWLDHMSGLYGGFAAFLDSVTWGTFEHLMFQYYLVLERGYRFEDVRHLTGDRTPEELWLTETFAVMEATGQVPSWAHLNAVTDYISPEQLDRSQAEFTMLMHVDRIFSRLD